MCTSNEAGDFDIWSLVDFSDTAVDRRMLTDDVTPGVESIGERQEAMADYDNGAPIDFATTNNVKIDNALLHSEHGWLSTFVKSHTQRQLELHAISPTSYLVEGNNWNQSQVMWDPISPALYALHLSAFPAHQSQPSSDLTQPGYAPSLTRQHLIQPEEHSASQPEHIKERDTRRPKRGNTRKTKRKVLNRVNCDKCGKVHAETRDWGRHMVANHRAHAKEIGLDVSKVACKVCGKEFDSIRKDHLTRHKKKKHPLD